MTLRVVRLNLWRKLGIHLVSTSLVFILLFFLLKNLDFAVLFQVLSSARWSLVALAAGMLLTLNTLGRVLRFTTLLKHLPGAPEETAFWRISAILLGARTLNMVLPAKAGEVYRAVGLKRCGYPLEGITAALLLEPVIELMGLATASLGFVLLGVLLGLSPHSAGMTILHKFIQGGGIVVCIFLLFALFSRRSASVSHPALPSPGRLAKVSTGFHKLAKSIQLLNSPSIWLKTIGWTLFADLIDLLALGLCLSSLGIDLGFINGFIVLAGINLAIAIPMPGNVGTLEAGAVLTLGALGIGKNEALAFALLYHSINLLPIAIAGAIALRQEGTRFKWKTRDAAAPQTLACRE